MNQSASAIIQTYTGKMIDLFAMRPEHIDIDDIAAGLRILRFNGQSRFPYSVAQHSVLVSETCNPEDALWGLLHDASEAYLGDIIGPLKVTPLMTGYRELERNVMAAICEAYDLPLVQPASVTNADMVLLATEKRDVLCHPDLIWSLKLPEPLPPDPEEYSDADRPVSIVPLSSTVAMHLFLHRFEMLTR